MELNEKMIKFNENVLPGLIEEQQKIVSELENKLSDKPKKREIHNFVLESFRLMSLMLEQTNTEIMTQNPEEEDPIRYNIVKKTNPYNWTISDGEKEYKIKRGANGVFKFNKKDIYCYVSKNEEGI